MSPCHTSEEFNESVVREFNSTLRKSNPFSCYVHLDEDTALWSKGLSFWTMFHSLFWPGLIGFSSFVLMTATWLLAGCRVWANEKLVV
ncbi:hypothetical protein Ciccas_006253 [Cichlidogyrus casuarinus]|uniref:Uncharacterized protein n=1 Tax=Cichlidogyrus casuarinus TaxID=1844966 RepID=A0ABD2Q7A1_9PLAT